MKSRTRMVIQRVNRSRACVWFEFLAALLGWRSSGMRTPCSWKKITDVSKEPPARSWKFPERVYRSTKLRFCTSQNTVIRTIFGSFFDYVNNLFHCIFMRQLIWRWIGVSQVNMSSNWFQQCIYLRIQVLVNKHRRSLPIGVLRHLRNCSLKTLPLFAD